MNMRDKFTVERTGPSIPASPWMKLGVAAVAAFLCSTQPAYAKGANGKGGGQGACSATAKAAQKACKYEVKDDDWIGRAICYNLSDADEQTTCEEELAEETMEAKAFCEEQHEARLDLCGALGEDPYDPDWDPGMFDSDFTSPTMPNPYWPLDIGAEWEFEGGDEEITVTVLNETKSIDGVTCIVVNDVVTEGGELIEDTDDWYGQATNGDTWYCGEIALNFETFPGDNPDDPELIDIEGSWKAGNEAGDKPGVIMFHEYSPEFTAGTVYRQEVSWGNAEDAAEILSTSYYYPDGSDLDDLVPAALATIMCSDGCVVTREFTPVEPGAEAIKYYARDVGVFLEVEDGEIVELVSCTGFFRGRTGEV